MAKFHVFQSESGRVLAVEDSIKAFRNVTPDPQAELLTREPVELGIAMVAVITCGGTLHRASGRRFQGFSTSFLGRRHVGRMGRSSAPLDDPAQ